MVGLSNEQLLEFTSTPVLDSEDKSKLLAALNMSRDNLLKGIHVFRAHSQTELLAVLNNITLYIKSHPKIRLVVIDSIAFHFRQDLQDKACRTRLLSLIAQTLNQNAFQSHIAVVVINQMTTKIEKSLIQGHTVQSTVVPALGEVWFHSVANRIILSWRRDVHSLFDYENDEERVATLVKSSYRPSGEAVYVINEYGVRDYKRQRSNDEGIGGTQDTDVDYVKKSKQM